MWLRLAYPAISALLGEQLDVMRQKMIDFDMKFISNISEKKGDGLPENPYRNRFIHLLNHKTLFEFCIPAIEDYGAALKGNNWDIFKRCYDQLMFSSPVAAVKVPQTISGRCTLTS